MVCNDIGDVCTAMLTTWKIAQQVSGMALSS